MWQVWLLCMFLWTGGDESALDNSVCGCKCFRDFRSGVIITHDHVPLECFGLHEIGEFARAGMKHVNKFINAGKRLLSFL